MSVDPPLQDKAILWDLDGVLIDTGEFHYLAWFEVLQDYGIRLTRQAFRQVFGMKNPETVAALLGEAPDPQATADISLRKEESFRRSMRGKVTLLPGVKLWLDRFARAGLRQAIASSAPQANIDALVDEAGIRAYFAAIVTTGGLPGKPDPATFLAAAAALSVPAADCLVIEDSVAGVQAARRAGMKCLAVTNTHPRRRLQQAGLVVDSLEQVTWEIIQALFE